MVREYSVKFKGLLALALFAVFVSALPVFVNAKPILEHHEMPIETHRDFRIISFEFPANAELGTETKGVAVIRNIGTGGGEDDVEVRINSKLHSLTHVNLQPGQESRYPIRLRFRETGLYKIEVLTPQDSKSIEVMVSNSGEESPPLGEPAAPPPTGGPINLQLLDINSDCTIGDDEFFSAIDRWISNILDDILFFSVVDAWVSQRSICAASNSRGRTNVSLSHAVGAIFTAGGHEIITMDVQVYDLSGAVVFTGRSNGSRLIWNLNSRSGQPVANGVYYYRVKTQGIQGDITVGPIKKLAIIR